MLQHKQQRIDRVANPRYAHKMLQELKITLCDELLRAKVTSTVAPLRTAFTDTGLLNGFVFSFSINPLVWFVH